MIVPTGRSLFRLSTNSPCRTYTVDARYLALQRVSAIFAALSTSSRPIPSQSTSSIPSYRRYETTTTKAVSRPKAHTGRTTSTTKKSTAKKPATTKVKETTTVKKTAAKPKAKSKSKTEPKTKSKAKSKAKKPVKRNVKRKTKKSPTEKEAKNKKIRELKVKALKLPKQQPATSWLVYWINYIKENKKPDGLAIGGLAKEASAKFKNIIPEEREVCAFSHRPILNSPQTPPPSFLQLLTSTPCQQHWNHVANQNKSANQAMLKDWLESRPVEEITQAQLARKHLRRLGVRGQYGSLLHDERRLKRPVNARNLFYQDRVASGDFRGISNKDRFKMMSDEFAKLSVAEKEVSYCFLFWILIFGFLAVLWVGMYSEQGLSGF